jgi:hypothetical protein
VLSSDFVKPNTLRATKNLKKMSYAFSATGLPQTYPTYTLRFVGALINLWLSLFPIFLFTAQPKEIFLDGLKLEQQSHKCVELRGEYVE